MFSKKDHTYAVHRKNRSTSKKNFKKNKIRDLSCNIGLLQGQLYRRELLNEKIAELKGFRRFCNAGCAL